MNLEHTYKLAPNVRVEPEQFGALLYAPQQRRPFFLFNQSLAEFVQSLDGQQPLGPALDQYLVEHQISRRDRPDFVKALNKLEKLELLREA